MRAAGVALAASLLLAESGCRCSGDEGTPGNQAARAAPIAPPAAGAASAGPEQIDLLQELGSCEIEHHGRLLDFGGAELPQRSFSTVLAETPPTIDRGGDRYERLMSRETLVDFWLDEPSTDLTVTLRLHPMSAKWVTVAVDDKRLGQQRLVPNETRTLTFGATNATVSRGRHRISLRLSGAPRGSKEPLADLDWVRIGSPLPAGLNYAAPTLRDVTSDVVLDGVPKRAIVLRPPSVVRCFMRPAGDAKLRMGLGFWGTGRGTAEIALVSDEKPPRVLSTRKLSGGDGASFTPVTLDLSAAGSELVGLELRAPEGTRGGRVVFGDPTIGRGKPEQPHVPAAKTVVLIVLASVDRGRLPPWGPAASLTTLSDLAKQAAAFSAHRAPSSVPAASFASLLSGVAPAVHGIQAPGERLRQRVATLAETVKEAGGRTALFTGVPTSFRPFGFDAGFDAFEAVSPVLDLPATEPLARAQGFLERELVSGAATQHLVVVALRGGHPPWDLTREETALLKPQEYAGILDPRRGGIVLGALRERQRKTARRIGDDDWIRLRALHDAALAKQDAALGKLIAMLKEKGAWDSTLLVVTSDVGLGNAPDIPFDPAAPLTEDRLLLPLLMRFPGGALAGREVTLPSTVSDVAHTLLKALGLDLSRRHGSDLFARGSGSASLTGGADLATSAADYSARLGSWLLRGSTGKVPRLCAQDIDPACATDGLDQKPLAARALWLSASGVAARNAREAAPLGPRERAELDAETAAALTVWGDLR